MTTPVATTFDFGGRRGITGLANPQNPQEAATRAYVDSLVEGLAWKDNCRVSTQANVNLASPGATVDGINLTNGDRVLVRFQTAGSENGPYIWNGSTTPMTRTADANAAEELEQAVVSVDEGTSAGTTWRQTSVNFTLGTGTVTWASFNPGAPAASETTPGVAEIATQAETDAGTDDQRIVTPLKLANWSGRARRFSGLLGDGTATSIVITHNFNTRDVQAYLYEASGSYREAWVEKQHTSVNTLTFAFEVAPTASAYRFVILA